METAVKVSLIVPMYCCENYITELLDNLCGQDYKDIEIICVDDGSPDNTLGIVRKYAETDSRIRVLSQEHRNAGSARNLGLSRARGEFVMFPDADDLYARDYVSRMLEAVETNGADIAVCHYITRNHSLGVDVMFAGYKCLFMPKDRPVSPESIRDLISVISSVPHNKIFRRDLIESNHLRFSETFSINDVFFVAAALVSAGSIVLVEDHLFTYNYLKQQSSISVSRGKHPEDIATVFCQLYEWLREHDLAERYLSDFFQRCSNTIRYYASFCTGEAFPEVVARMLASEEPWRSLPDRELRKKAMLYCGLEKTCLKKYRKKLSADDLTPEQRELLMERCTLAERQVRNYSETIRILREKYHKDLRGRDDRLTMRAAQVRQAGAAGTLQILYRKVLNRRSSS